MKKIAVFKEPVKHLDLTLALFKIDELKRPPFQRDISSTLTRLLEMSIDKIGFLVPVIAVKKDEVFYVIDGQHRLEALRNLGATEILGIVVDESLYHNILEFNTEKPPTVKEKSKQTYRLYQEFLNSDPEVKESDLYTYFKDPVFITFGFALEELDSKFPAGFYENFVSKIDNFLDVPINKAESERRKRAEALVELNKTVSEKYAEFEWSNTLLKGEIVRKAVQKAYGIRTRTIDSDFFEAVENVKNACASLTQEDFEG